MRPQRSRYLSNSHSYQNLVRWAARSLANASRWWHTFTASSSANLILHHSDSSASWISSYRFGAVASQHEQLRVLAKRLEEVREEERARVARDLHDDIGQLLTAVKMDLVWISKHMIDREDEARERIGEAVKLVSDGVCSVRKICTGLHPSALNVLGLSATIEWEAERFSSRSGIPCRLSLPSESLNLPDNDVTVIFRVFQECLTNIGRHAHAHSVDVSLYRDGKDLVLKVRDDGKGFSEAACASGLGLLGMKERAETCGGQLLIDASPGKGTAVALRIPIQSETPDSLRYIN